MMILYHFTDFYYLENGTILQEGLKPDCREGEVKMTLAPSGVVWLTTDTEDTWRKPKNECRITVVIPSTDQRLVRFETWLREHHPPDVLAAAQAINNVWRSWWLYFGRVPLSKFRAIEKACNKGKGWENLHPELVGQTAQ